MRLRENVTRQKRIINVFLKCDLLGISQQQSREEKEKVINAMRPQKEENSTRQETH